MSTVATVVGSPDGPRVRALRVWLKCVLGASLAAFLIAVSPAGERGFRFELGSGGQPVGQPVTDRPTREVDLDFLAWTPSLRSRELTASWRGVWVVHQAGERVLHVKSHGRVVVKVDGQDVVTRPLDARSFTDRVVVPLSSGAHTVDVAYSASPDRAFVRLLWSVPGGVPRGFGGEDVVVASSPSLVSWLGWRRVLQRGLEWLLLILLVTAVVAHVRWSADPAGGTPASLWERVVGRRFASWPRAVALVLPVLVVLWAASLRFEALVLRFWAGDAPPLARQTAVALGHLRWDGLKWHPADHRYEGDPTSYLQYAREQRSFYDAHRREPVFVFATRAGLWVSGGDDIGVSFASAAFSWLAVWATFRLGAEAFGRVVGLLAAFLLAGERQVVTTAIEGWRDDAFMALTLLTAWGLVRLLRRPTWPAAVLTGVAAALACLTRVTALSFVLPALAILALAAPPTERRRRWLQLGASAVVLVLLVAPFLIACWRAYGDPLYAINVHTQFYRSEAGQTWRPSMGWSNYLAESFRPWQMAELGLIGLTAYPFSGKWTPFDYWWPGLGTMLAIAALLGLGLWLRQPAGRLLLAILVAATLPFAFTWEVPGGSEWRFTLYAYPFYLLAAAGAIQSVVGLVRPGAWRTLATRRVAGLACGGAALAGVVWWGTGWLHVRRIREAVAAGVPVSVALGPRDRLVLTEGWRRGGHAGRLLREAEEASALVLPSGAGTVAELWLERGPRSAEPRVEAAAEGVRLTTEVVPEGRGLFLRLALPPPGPPRRIVVRGIAGWNLRRLVLQPAAGARLPAEEERPDEP